MELLTVKEVANALRVADITIYKWLENGDLKGIKLAGKIWRIPATELNRILGIK